MRRRAARALCRRPRGQVRWPPTGRSRGLDREVALPLAALLAAVLMLTATAAPPAWGAEPAAEAVRAKVFRTLEGRVVALEDAAAEGDLPVVAVKVAVGDDEYQVLLAPAVVLRQAEFEVAVGDHLRARVFAEAGSEIFFSQKVMNLSRRRLLRLRTLRHEPLWDVAGRWQGQRPEARRPSHRRRQARPQRPPSRSRPPARPPLSR